MYSKIARDIRHWHIVLGVQEQITMCDLTVKKIKMTIKPLSPDCGHFCPILFPNFGSGVLPVTEQIKE